MFFYLSKILWVVAAPANALLLLLVVAAFGLRSRHWRLARQTATICGLLLVAIAFMPIGTAMLRVLENRFPQPAADLAAPTGMIVLGGSTDETLSDARDQVTVTGAATRLTAAVALSRRFPAARLVFSGGSGALLLRPRTEAEDTRRLWISLGVPAERITTEDRSRNTHENALFTRGVLNPKPGERWLLVTSAWHMPRAVGAFRAVGFPVIPFPVDYQTTGTWHDALPSGSSIEGLRRFDLATKEWVGLLAYRLTGRSDALLPGSDAPP